MTFAHLQATIRHQALSAAVLLLCLASAPAILRAQSQWSGTAGGPIYYSGGNVGIWTSAPTAPLDVNGVLNVFDSGTKTLYGGLATEVGSKLIDFGINDSSFGSQTNSSPGGFLRVETRADPLFTFFGRTAGGTSLNALVNITGAGSVGIGTTSPGGPLDVRLTTNSYNWQMAFGATTASGAGGGGNAFGLSVGASPLTGYAVIQAHSNWGDAGGAGNLLDISNNTGSALVVSPLRYVGIGTTNPTNKLSVAGTVQAYEVLVNTGWSDYVFAPNYHLRPLTEVAAYIEQNHHLPDIPSAAEVKEKGVSVGEMESKLLAKIEELTLHMIQAEERNDRLERQNQDLQKAIAQINQRLSEGGK